MKRLTRRDFLKSLSIGLGAATLTACSREAASEAEPLLAAPAHTSTPVESPTGAAGFTGAPDLVVARNGDPEEMVRRALDALGGMQRFVASGDSVIVKPNICNGYHTYEYASTTNPWVVGALVKLALEAGAASVKVLDFPFGGAPEQAYAKSGIAEQVEAAGGEMVVMSRIKFMPTTIANGMSLTQTDIFDDVLKTDVLINVPIAKDHSLARLTLGMKNLMGVILDRPAIHSSMGQRLTDLNSFVPSTLTVVDAVRMLMDHGPTGGSLDDVKQMDTIIASPDIVAADSYAATLFGMQPNDLSYVKAGVEAGLGRNDLENLRIEEIAVGA